MSAINIAQALCQRWEGCSLTAYPDPASGGEPWTIGYGQTGQDITAGTVWTQAQADAALMQRISELSTAIQSELAYPMNDNQLGACISLAYNIGLTAFSNSTLLKDWNAGEVQAAADQFLVWNRATGKVMQGLVNRRADERSVFLGGDPS